MKRLFLCVIPLFWAGVAAAAPVDCAAIFAKTPAEAVKVAPADIQQCINRGASPPASWRARDGKSSGVNVPGSGSSMLGVVQGPERSPGAVGAPYSVSGNAFNFALSFPPWSGFPCQLPGGANVCGSGTSLINGLANGILSGGNPADIIEKATTGTSDTGSSSGGTTGTGTTTASSGGAFCPQETDTSGTFGKLYALSSGQSGLVCGGAIPLTSYQLSLTRNATQLAATEYGSYYVWLYQQSGAGYAPLSGSPIALPSYLCMPDSHGRMQQSVALSAPVAQMITYNKNASFLTIRLQPLDLAANPSLVDYEGDERYLTIPLVGGVPQVPANCARETDYFKTVSMPQVDMAFDGIVTPLCEEGQFCNAVTVTAPAGGTCNAVTSYPQGTVQTSSGTVDCKGKIQISILSRPNLIFPPGSSPTASVISGRTAMMVNTINGADLYLPSGSVRLSTAAPSLTLPSGGTVDMASGGKILMNAPATVNPGSNSITLTGGGEYIAANGSSQQTYTPGSTISGNFTSPMTVYPERDIALPAGYAIPTQPNPYVRLPVETQ